MTTTAMAWATTVTGLLVHHAGPDGRTVCGCETAHTYDTRPAGVLCTVCPLPQAVCPVCEVTVVVHGGRLGLHHPASHGLARGPLCPGVAS